SVNLHVYLIAGLEVCQLHQGGIKNDALRVTHFADRLNHDVILCFTLWILSRLQASTKNVNPELEVEFLSNAFSWIFQRRSQVLVIRLESAPLGAFVPWQPLTQLLVPALEPGESRDLSTEV